MCKFLWQKESIYCSLNVLWGCLDAATKVLCAHVSEAAVKMTQLFLSLHLINACSVKCVILLQHQFKRSLRTEPRGIKHLKAFLTCCTAWEVWQTAELPSISMARFQLASSLFTIKQEGKESNKIEVFGCIHSASCSPICLLKEFAVCAAKEDGNNLSKNKRMLWWQHSWLKFASQITNPNCWKLAKSHHCWWNLKHST